MADKPTYGELEQRIKEVEKELTELKLSEELANKTQKGWQEVFDSITDFVSIHDMDYRFVKVNKALADFLKAKPEELIGKHCYKLLHDMDTPWANCPHTKALELKKPVTEDVDDPHIGCPLLVTASPIFDEHGELVGSVHVAKNISQRKQVEEALQRKSQIQSVFNEMLRLSMEPWDLEEMLEHILEPIASFSWLALQAKGVIFLTEEKPNQLFLKSWRNVPRELRVMCNRVPFGWCLCGRAAQTKEIQFASSVDERHDSRYAGMPPHGHYCVPIMSADKLLGVLNLYLKAGHRRSKEEEALLMAIGNVLAGIIERKKAQLELDKHRWHLEELVKERTVKLKQANNQLEQEIAERKLAEEALRESEGKLRSVFDNMQDVFYRADSEGRVVWVSPSAVEMLGYESTDELVGRNLAEEFYEDPGKRKVFLQELLQKGRVSDYEVELRKRDGSTIIVSTNSHYCKNERGEIIGVEGSCRDITKRWQAEEALRQSEKRFRDVVMSLSDWVWEVDKDARYTYCSERVLDVLGYAAEDLLGRTPFKLMPPQEASRVRKIFEELSKDQEAIVDLENWNISKKGRKVCLLTNGVPMYDREGIYIGYRGVDKDITERKQAAEALQESEERYRSFVQNFQGIAYRGNINFVPIFFHGAVEEITGYTEQDFTAGKPRWDQVIHPKDLLTSFAETADKVRLVPNYSTEREYRIIRKDGELRWVHELIQNICDNLGKPILVQGTIYDITDRKRAEEELKQRVQELAVLSSLSRQVSASLSLNQVVQAAIKGVKGTVNPDLALIFLRADNELLFQGSCPDPNRFYPDKIAVHQVGECLCGLAVSAGKALYSVNIHADPRCTWEECKKAGFRSFCALPLRSRDKIIGVLGLASLKERDFGAQDVFLETLSNEITFGLQNAILYEQVSKHGADLEKRVGEEVEKSRQKDIMMINQSRLAVMGEMIGLIAHQWRQPLNALHILLYNIKDLFYNNRLTPEVLDDLTEKGTSLAKKMSTTIDDFRDFFKPYRQKKRFCINRIIKDSLSLIDASFKYNNISVAVSEREELAVVGFPNEYSQVMLNMLSNAKDAILSRGISGEVRIDIFREDDFAVVKVWDNGGGIPEEILDAVFAPYFTLKKGKQGTGLGLYLSKVIIEDHMDGRIDVQNRQDGAEFTIITPVHQK